MKQQRKENSVTQIAYREQRQKKLHLRSESYGQNLTSLLKNCKLFAIKEPLFIIVTGPIMYRSARKIAKRFRIRGSSDPGLCPGWGYCVVFLDKALYSHSASLSTQVYK